MYDPIFWKDHFVEYARRYSMTQGESAGLVYLHPAPGEVEQQGTPQNAANFTHMDYGILEQAIMTNFLYVSTKHYAETLSEVKDYAYGVYEQSTGYTDKRIADLIGAPPETLDTIEKLADALKENEDVVNAINAAIVKKANQSVLETHMNNEYIHVDADKQEKWNGYEQQIADLNSNLNDIKSIIGTAWVKKATVGTNTASGAHALLTVSGNVYYIYSSGGNLTIINIQNNARPDVTVTVNKLILNITSTANANMLVGIIPFNGYFTLT